MDAAAARVRGCAAVGADDQVPVQDLTLAATTETTAPVKAVNPKSAQTLK
jgi:hypothetical protein